MPVKTLEKNSIEQSLPLINPELEQQNLGSIDPDRSQPFCFSYRFTDAMLMGADLQTVGKYLDAHQGWFTRCAQPMQVNSLGKNGYALTIGNFNSFGYIIEPKIGLELLPQDRGVYRIQTVEIPDYTPPGYEVSFNAQMRLGETLDGDRLGTKIDWDLDLNVYIQFPKFIHKLPAGVIQGTGDKVLKQIVNRVSRQLTHKVQQDFHGNLGLKIPKC
jgi:Protein of unknown function (DUF1997)